MLPTNLSQLVNKIQYAMFNDAEKLAYDEAVTKLITDFNKANPNGLTVKFSLKQITMKPDGSAINFVLFPNGKSVTGNYVYSFAPNYANQLCMNSGIANWQMLHVLNANSVEDTFITLTFVGRLKGSDYTVQKTGEVKQYTHSLIAATDPQIQMPASIQGAIINAVTNQMVSAFAMPQAPVSALPTPNPAVVNTPVEEGEHIE